MVNTEAKYKQETWEVVFLLKHLGITEQPQKGESPDFTFDYEGKHIGLEHTKCFPNRKTIDNNSWRKIEGRILEELNKSNLSPRLFIYGVATHQEGNKNYKDIAEEILNGYRYMLDNEVCRIDAADNHGFRLDKLTHLSYCPSIFPERFMLSETVGGAECKEVSDSIIEAVSKKENKLADYKQLQSNNTIQEYWLAIYIPTDEYCVIDCDATLFTDSQYDRIYLINGRYIGALMQADTSSIKRLK